MIQIDRSTNVNVQRKLRVEEKKKNKEYEEEEQEAESSKIVKFTFSFISFKTTFIPIRAVQITFLVKWEINSERKNEQGGKER